MTESTIHFVPPSELKALAIHLLSLSEAAIDDAQNAGELIGVNCDA